jgi:predicted MFS family arabinose efflux permease
MTRAWRALRLAALAAAVALAFADSSIVVLALPKLIDELGASVPGVAAVVTAYNVALVIGLVALLRPIPRLDPARTARAGLALFLVASLFCATAPGLWELVAARSLQGLGAALLLASALPLARSLAPSPGRGSRVWAGAAAVGLAVGPASGGALTQIFDWRAVFVAQLPVVAAALVATLPRTHSASEEGAAQPERAGRRTAAANAGLALVSAALVGLLFLAVILLVEVWGMSPLGAAAVVSAIPAGSLVARRLRGEGVLPLVAGVALLAGGLVAFALLPWREPYAAAAALGLAGIGIGLLLPGLDAAALDGSGHSVRGATVTLLARHAGLVAALLVLTPLLAADLDTAGRNARASAVASALEAPQPISTKISLARRLAPLLTGSPTSLPDLGRKATDASSRSLAATVDDAIRASLQRGFRRSFLVAAAFALLALGPVLLLGGAVGLRQGRWLPAAAAAAVTVFVCADFAGGALAYGAPPTAAPCAKRAGPSGPGLDLALQRLALRGLDGLACSLGTGREQLLLEAADGAASGLRAAHDLRDSGHDLEALVRRLAARLRSGR